MDVQYGSEAIVQVGDSDGLNQKSFGAGIRVPNAVVTLRGGNASNKLQKSYRIEFKTFADNWNDQNILYLNKYVEDGVRCRTAISQKIAEETPGMTALDTTFVHLFVKDNTVEGEDLFIDYGLYTQIERPDSDFLQRVGLDMGGELYKAENFDLTRHADAIKMTSDPTYDVEAFEAILENKGDTEDNTDLINMLEALNAPDADIEKILPLYFDEENYYSFLALQILLGNSPEATRDYLLYSPSDSSKFYFMMWDADHILYNAEEKLLNRKYDIREEAIAMTTGGLPFYKNKLHKMVLTNENCVEKLTAKMDELTEPLYESIRSFGNAYSTMIKPLCFSQPDIMSLPLSPDDYDQVSGNLNNEFIENRNRFRDDIEKPSPFSVTDISVSPDGETLIIDWEDALDTTGAEITYDITVALRYTLQQDIYLEEGLTESRFEAQMPEMGQYFISIVASDESGNEREQYAYYEDIFDERHAGILCFYINPDNPITWQGI
jgi:spore coat protein H